MMDCNSHQPAASGPGMHILRAATMAEFWVTGGEYADATFKDLTKGRDLERYGPFSSYDAARKEWQSRTMATIDNALVRYRVISLELSSKVA
jgi:hypothetical protein